MLHVCSVSLSEEVVLSMHGGCSGAPIPHMAAGAGAVSLVKTRMTRFADCIIVHRVCYWDGAHWAVVCMDVCAGTRVYLQQLSSCWANRRLVCAYRTAGSTAGVVVCMAARLWQEMAVNVLLAVVVGA